VFAAVFSVSILPEMQIKDARGSFTFAHRITRRAQTSEQQTAKRQTHNNHHGRMHPTLYGPHADNRQNLILIQILSGKFPKTTE